MSEPHKRLYVAPLCAAHQRTLLDWLEIGQRARGVSTLVIAQMLFFQLAMSVDADATIEAAQKPQDESACPACKRPTHLSRVAVVLQKDPKHVADVIHGRVYDPDFGVDLRPKPDA